MTFSLHTSKRDGMKVSDLRAAGKIPGVVYGGDRTGATSFVVAYNEFDKVYNEAGESTLIDLHLEGESEPVKVIVQDLQHDPMKGTISHVDLKQVKMGEEMDATVELIYINEAPAVKELGGTLVKSLESIEIRCLPQHLISHIDIDLSTLKTFEDSIEVAHLKLPSTVTVLTDLDTMIATVTPPISEDELKKMEEQVAPSIEDIQVEEKGKKEEEAPAAE